MFVRVGRLGAAFLGDERAGEGAEVEVDNVGVFLEGLTLDLGRGVRGERM
jgi:hypothetical protein